MESEKDLIIIINKISQKHANQPSANNAARLTQCDNIGFITGQALELQSFSLLGFLLSRCETGRDALVTLRRYYMLLSDSPAPDIFITKNEIKVIYHISKGNDLAMRAHSPDAYRKKTLNFHTY